MIQLSCTRVCYIDRVFVIGLGTGWGVVGVK